MSTQKAGYKVPPFQAVIAENRSKVADAGRNYLKDREALPNGPLKMDSSAAECPTGCLTSLYDSEHNGMVKRLEAGADAFSLFRRPIPPTGKPYFWKPEPPTNWGLFESKQEKWREEKIQQELQPLETSCYTHSYKWPMYVLVAPEDMMPQPRQGLLRHGLPREVSTRLLPLNLTNKDWHLRGKTCQLLPVPWMPPVPRWPSDMASSRVGQPELDRYRNINNLLRRTTYEVQHPAEQWAANIYLQ